MSGARLRFGAAPGYCGAWLWDLSVFGDAPAHCELKRDHDGPHRHGKHEWTHEYVRIQPAQRSGT